MPKMNEVHKQGRKGIAWKSNERASSSSSREERRCHYCSFFDSGCVCCIWRRLKITKIQSSFFSSSAAGFVFFPFQTSYILPLLCVECTKSDHMGGDQWWWRQKAIIYLLENTVVVRSARLKPICSSRRCLSNLSNLKPQSNRRPPPMEPPTIHTSINQSATTKKKTTGWSSVIFRTFFRRGSSPFKFLGETYVRILCIHILCIHIHITYVMDFNLLINQNKNTDLLTS